MVATIPAGVQLGFVAGQFVLAVGDTDIDVDHTPDPVAAQGTVIFTPYAKSFASSTTTIVPAVVICNVNDDGALTDPTGRVGVWLVAGAYRVSFKFNGVKLDSFDITVTSAYTEAAPLQLASAAPLTPSPIVKFVVDEQVYTQTLAARDEAAGLVLRAKMPRQRNHATAVIGDSIDAGGDDSTGPNPYWSGSIWSRLALFTDQRFHLSRNVGVGGNTTAQMLARFQTHVAAFKPGVVVIGGGRNDISGGVNPETTKANIQALVDAAMTAGIVPVLHTVPPLDTPPGGGQFSTLALARAATIAHNDWLRAYAAASGIALIDLWKFWANPATGGYKATFSDDGVHPSTAATSFFVNAQALELPPQFAGSAPLPMSNTDPTNLMPNALATTDANADNIPDLWYFPQPTKMTYPTGTVGKVPTVTTTDTSQSTFYSPATAAGAIATGDVIAFSGRLTKTAGVRATLQMINQDTYQSVATPFANLTDATSGNVFYIEYVVGAGVTRLAAAITATNAVGSVGVGQLSIKNLTALGLR